MMARRVKPLRALLWRDLMPRDDAIIVGCSRRRHHNAMRTAILGTLMTLTVTAAPAEQDLNSANYVLPGCRAGLANRPSIKAGFCLGIVHAIALMTGRRKLCECDRGLMTAERGQGTTP